MFARRVAATCNDAKTPFELEWTAHSNPGDIADSLSPWMNPKLFHDAIRDGAWLYLFDSPTLTMPSERSSMSCFLGLEAWHPFPVIARAFYDFH
uniref:Neur_chan_LBD domain-containing protein n=1 Tax=Panagrellus redivivus TaxID=6233 RepID=A0A7E4UY57_PANRE